MIAKPMEKTVGVRGDSGRRQRDQRAHGRRRAFQREPVEELAVDVGVRGRIRFEQVPAASTVTVLLAPANSRLIFSCSGTTDRTSTS